ncbi:CMRF35-like molecule 8 isoform X1 [Octodon degus]|uniref:CMRF35-like molecule 8 isoform X1 n=1 Tax=Octodon degus TaxID=10160 RepID=A0A6P6ECK6_OCTDE|nr:CMRF35-like molecule 8 isoform X1 [Octodon degus]XP_023569803.1 CMRF35-like molecule 8 isoform X1 [Octodon degus]
MSPRGGLPWALLLLWLPGCFLLSDPSTVTGTVGGSLSVQCWYEEHYKTYAKYWCKESFITCDKIVETDGSEREVRNGRVTIRDHPANLSFTVTLENLALQDAGSYWCAINIRWQEDPVFSVTVSVLPAPEATSEKPTTDTIGSTSSTTTEVPAASFTRPWRTTHTSSSQENQQDVQASRLPVLLSILGILLLLLGGLSLLTWRILQKQHKGGERPRQGRNPRQAAEQCEPHYANLQLHTWSLQEEPTTPRQVEVEYSTVANTREDLHYSSVVFESQKPGSNANGVSVQRPQEEEPEYSVVKKPENHLPSPSSP